MHWPVCIRVTVLTRMTAMAFFLCDCACTTAFAPLVQGMKNRELAGTLVQVQGMQDLELAVTS